MSPRVKRPSKVGRLQEQVSGLEASLASVKSELRTANIDKDALKRQVSDLEHRLRLADQRSSLIEIGVRYFTHQITEDKRPIDVAIALTAARCVGLLAGTTPREGSNEFFAETLRVP